MPFARLWSVLTVRNSLWLTRGIWALVPALTAASVVFLPASAQAGARPSGQAGARPSKSASASPSGSAPGLSGEWWLDSLSAQQEWSAGPQEGAGVTVAVLSTGVDGTQPDLTGNVAPGPDFTGLPGSGNGTYRGDEGTEIASLIAGHGHGDGSQGITGIAPKARILPVRVTLDPQDPQLGKASTAERLPGAIANGINYAVSHGARVIDLPADPATLAGSGKAAKAGMTGGSPAEQSAVRHALARDVVLVAPAGDTGTAPETGYPAAYPGVVSAGATDQDGHLAPFSSTGSYVSLTAPGAGVTAARAGSGYTTLSSTDASAALTSGIAALIRSRYPRLSAAQVAKALKSSAEPVAGHQPGTGAGSITATNAVTSADSIVSLIGTPGPRLGTRLPEDAAIAGGAVIVVVLVIAGIMRLRRRRLDDDIPDWGNGLPGAAPGHARPGYREDPADQPDPPASQRGPGSPGRRASAADAVGRASAARIGRDTGPIPRHPDQNRSAPYPGMPPQGSSRVSGPMRAANTPLPQRQSRKRAPQPGSHRR